MTDPRVPEEGVDAPEPDDEREQLPGETPAAPAAPGGEEASADEGPTADPSPGFPL
jgi:hypothetical protein